MPLEQRLEQVQKLILTQTMQQSLQFLQMSTLELADFLQDAALSNPLLEVELPSQSQPIPDSSEREPDNLAVEFQEQSIWSRSLSRNKNADAPDFSAFYSKTQSFSEYLNEQLGQMKQLDPATLVRCRYLVGCLNSIGYLDCTLSELAEETQQSLFDMEQALFVLQSLDPIGVGARSLSECLLLQLAEGPEFNEVNIRLIQDGLPLLAKDDYPALAKQLRVSVAEARRAAEVIRQLNPIPSRGFSTEDTFGYVQPEAVIRSENGQIVVETNRHHLPHVTLNEEYCSLVGSKGCEDAQPYLKEKIVAAKNLISSMDNRYDTISRLLNAIVHMQRAYFLHSGSLQPMTMKQLADQLDLNPSTVSRAVKEKYIQFDGRIVPLRGLFTTALQSSDGEAVSSEAARQQIKRFVSAEAAEKPLSDEALCEALAGVGITLARRTVAKYRSELGIPSASIRKRKRS